MEELVGNLQTYEANHCQSNNGKEIALKSSKSVEDDSKLDCDLDGAEFKKYFVRKFRKMWKNKKAMKDSQNPEAPSKTKFGPKPEKNPSKGSSKPIQCYECQGHGHTAAKCANRKEKSKAKTLNVF